MQLKLPELIKDFEALAEIVCTAFVEILGALLLIFPRTLQYSNKYFSIYNNKTMTATEKIDEYVNKTGDWRGDLITEIRQLIHEIEPNIEEEWKWNSPVFSHKGKMVCSPGAFKTHVGLNFFNGVFIEDPNGFFPKDSQAKQMRSIKFKKEEEIDKEALKILLKNAIDYEKK